MEHGCTHVFAFSCMCSLTSSGCAFLVSISVFFLSVCCTSWTLWLNLAPRNCTLDLTLTLHSQPDVTNRLVCSFSEPCHPTTQIGRDTFWELRHGSQTGIGGIGAVEPGCPGPCLFLGIFTVTFLVHRNEFLFLLYRSAYPVGQGRVRMSKAGSHRRQGRAFKEIFQGKEDNPVTFLS